MNITKNKENEGEKKDLILKLKCVIILIYYQINDD